MSTSFDLDQTSEMELDPATIQTFKIPELKRELKLRGLAVSGKKEELVERLQLAVMNVGSGYEDDDLLAQANALLEDDSMSSTEKKMLNRGQPMKKVAIKRDSTFNVVSEQSTDIGSIEIQNKAATKGIAKITSPDQVKAAAPNGRTTVGHLPQETIAQSDSNKAEPLIKTLSDAEKAKSRAERFGVAAPTDLDEKKAARAARFGISNASNKIGESPGVDLDTLKRRAERFGQSNSTTMQKLELQEKIKERESRFGKVDTSTTENKRPRIVSPNQNLVVDEKMKKRAERFGIKA